MAESVTPEAELFGQCNVEPKSPLPPQLEIEKSVDDDTSHQSEESMPVPEKYVIDEKPCEKEENTLLSKEESITQVEENTKVPVEKNIEETSEVPNIENSTEITKSTSSPGETVIEAKIPIENQKCPDIHMEIVKDTNSPPETVKNSENPIKKNIPPIELEIDTAILYETETDMEILFETEEKTSVKTKKDRKPSVTLKEDRRTSLEVENIANVSVDFEKDADIATDMQKDADVATDMQKDAEVSTVVQKDADVSMDVQKDTDISADMQKDADVLTDTDILVETHKDKDVFSEVQKDVDVSAEIQKTADIPNEFKKGADDISNIEEDTNVPAKNQINAGVSGEAKSVVENMETSMTVEKDAISPDEMEQDIDTPMEIKEVADSSVKIQNDTNISVEIEKDSIPLADVEKTVETFVEEEKIPKSVVDNEKDATEHTITEVQKDIDTSAELMKGTDAIEAENKETPMELADDQIPMEIVMEDANESVKEEKTSGNMNHTETPTDVAFKAETTMEFVKDTDCLPAKLTIKGVEEDENEEYLEITIEEAEKIIMKKVEQYIKDPNVNPLLILRNKISSLQEQIDAKNDELVKLNKAFENLYRDQVKFLRHIGSMPKLETKEVAVDVDLPWLPETIVGFLQNDQKSKENLNSATGTTIPPKPKKPSGPIECIDLTDDNEVAEPPKAKPSIPDTKNIIISSSPAVSSTTTSPMRATMHPAPLPVSTPIFTLNAAEIPPKPRLKISVDKNGIVLQWDLPPQAKKIKITGFEIFGYQEKNNVPVSSSLWKKIGCVNPMPLPMSCTLTQFVEGYKYHFSIRGISNDKLGHFSDPASIMFVPEKKA